MLTEVGDKEVWVQCERHLMGDGGKTENSTDADSNSTWKRGGSLSSMCSSQLAFPRDLSCSESYSLRPIITSVDLITASTEAPCLRPNDSAEVRVMAETIS